ncbi:MAG: patatin-like phospholipase family protein [Bdellovibrionales bacterium]
MSEEKYENLALVLSGGGIKAAAFHVGVVSALRQHGYIFAGGTKDRVENEFLNPEKTFKTYVGSSAGSIICGYLASGHSIENIIESFQMGNFFHKDLRNKLSPAGKLPPLRYRDIFYFNGVDFDGVNIRKLFPKRVSSSPLLSGGLEVLFKHGFKWNGLFSTRGIERYFREKVLPVNSFDDLGVDLFVIATQLNHSRKAIFGNFERGTKNATTKWVNFASISQSIAASAALPPVFAPYGIKNHKGKEIYFFDGEIRDTLSTHVAHDMGADLIFSSYSIQPYHFNDQHGSLHQFGIPVILNQALYQVVEQKIQSHIKYRNNLVDTISIVHDELLKNGYDKTKTQELIDTLYQNLGYRQGVKYVYIHPQARNHDFFFADHFSLNPDILRKIVRYGYKSALLSIRQNGL